MNVFYEPSFDEKSVVVNVSDTNEILHCFKSLRKKTGDVVHVINGKGLLVSGILEQIDKRNMIVKIDTILETDVEYNHSVHIAIGLPNKTSKMKLIVEKLTELGVREISFFKADYSIIMDKKIKNLESYAISALKQSGGVLLPKMSVGNNLNDYNINKDVYYCHFDGVKNIKSDEINNDVLIFIGPEGGFSQDELLFFKSIKAKELALNKRILRLETAAIVAASKFLQ